MAERPPHFENVFNNAGNQLCDFRHPGDFETPDHWLKMRELVSNYFVKADQPVQFGSTDLNTGAVAPVTCRVGLSHCLKQIRKAHQKGFRLFRIRVDALVFKVLQPFLGIAPGNATQRSRCGCQVTDACALQCGMQRKNQPFPCLRVLLHKLRSANGMADRPRYILGLIRPNPFLRHRSPHAPPSPRT